VLVRLIEISYVGSKNLGYVIRHGVLLLTDLCGSGPGYYSSYSYLVQPGVVTINRNIRVTRATRVIGLIGILALNMLAISREGL
jgi:hypothetical protein